MKVTSPIDLKSIINIQTNIDFYSQIVKKAQKEFEKEMLRLDQKIKTQKTLAARNKIVKQAKSALANYENFLKSIETQIAAAKNTKKE